VCEDNVQITQERRSLSTARWYDAQKKQLLALWTAGKGLTDFGLQPFYI